MARVPETRVVSTGAAGWPDAAAPVAADAAAAVAAVPGGRAGAFGASGVTAAAAGVAGTVGVAKIASRRAKPDGVVVVPPDQVTSFLHPLAVTELWGVGAKTGEQLHRLGLHTVGDLAHTPRPTLQRALGQALGLTLPDNGTPVLLTQRDEEPDWVAGPRIGISKNADAPLRFWIPGDKTVSSPRGRPKRR